jgi:hypothetical protein
MGIYDGQIYLNYFMLNFFLPWSRVHPLPQFHLEQQHHIDQLLETWECYLMPQLWHGLLELFDMVIYSAIHIDWSILHFPTPPQTKLSKAFPPNHLQNFECQSDFSDNNILPPHVFKSMKKIVQPFHQRNQQTLHCQKKFMTIKQCGGLGAIKPRS